MKDCGGWKEWLEKSGKVRIKNALKVNTLRAYAEFLRRGRDSNPRCSFPHNSFRDCHNRPLCHLSKKCPGRLPMPGLATRMGPRGSKSKDFGGIIGWLGGIIGVSEDRFLGRRGEICRIGGNPIVLSPNPNWNVYRYCSDYR